MFGLGHHLREMQLAVFGLSICTWCLCQANGLLAQQPQDSAGDAALQVSEPDASWLRLSPEVKITELTAAQYAGAISAAMEAMNLVYGDLSAADKQAFLKEWSPLFDYPCQEVIDYLARLNPLLGRYLTIRGAMAATASDFDAAWNEALTCGTLQFEDGIREALAIAHLKQQTLVALSDAMQQTVNDILELGPPPDVNALREQARRRHRAAVSALNPPGSQLDGEWIGEWEVHPTDERTGVGGSDEFLDILKDTIARQAREEGEAIAPDCHVLLTTVPEDSGGEFRLHVYNFDNVRSIRFLRQQQQNDSRLLGSEKQCKEWLRSFRNILLPPASMVADGHFRIEHESHQALDWKTRWVWDFELDGDELVVTEQGFLRTWGAEFIDEQPNPFDEGRPGHLFTHRSARLKRPAKLSAVPPAEWSMDTAYESEEVPEAAWVLQDVKVNEFPQPGGKRVQIDHRRGTAELLLPQSSGTAPVSVSFRWTPLPEKIQVGDDIALEYAFRQNSGRPRSTTLFMSDLGLGLTLPNWPDSYTAETSRAQVVKRPLFVPSLPFIPGRTDAVHVASGGDFAVDYVYLRVPADVIHDPDVQPRPSGDQTPPPDSLADDAMMRQERIKFHRECIRLIEFNMRRDAEELERTKDADNREILLSRIMNNQHNIYSELDRIREIETGQFVHTRTPIDDMYKARWEQSIVENARAVTRAHKLYEGVQRLPNLAPEDQREELRAFIHRQVDARTAVSGDVEKLEQVVTAVGNRVQGYWEAEAANSLDAALAAADLTKRCEDTKWWAEAALTAYTLGYGEHIPMIVFQAGSGFAETDGSAENRFWEATRRGLAWCNQATYVISEGMAGYEKGGWLGDNKGTIWGAIERAGEAFLLAKGLEFAAGKIFGTPATEAERRAYVKQQFEKARRDQAAADGLSLVDDYQRALNEYRRLVVSSANRRSAEIRAMEQQLQQKATSVYASYEAKLFLKKVGSDPRYSSLTSDYNRRIAQVHSQVRERFRQMMRDRNYDNVDRWVMRDIRNASSMGTVNMDHDIAIIDRYLNTAGKEMRHIFTQNGSRVSPIRFQREASRTWDQAFQQTTGYSGRLSGETLTTRTASSEAYMDLAWLGSGSSRRAAVSDISARYAAQAGDITAYKAGEIAAMANLTDLQKMMETARGTAKDINTKLVPVLEESARRMLQSNANRALEIDQHRKHWKQMADILTTAIDDPIGADRALRQLTGNRGVTEVVADARDMLANYGKFIGR